MYNLPCPIRDMRLQGTAHSSEEIELQGVMIWFLVNSWISVLIWDSWSFLRWWQQKILCGKNTCCSLCFWLFWMCVTGKSRSARLSISLLCRSFVKWSCLMKTGYWIGGQSQVQYCATCSMPPTSSSTIGMISKTSLQQTPRLRARTCWFQWCTCQGNSVMTLSYGGRKRKTQSLDPTPQRCDVPQHEHVVFVCVYFCIRVSLHTSILMNICIHILEYINIFALPYIHTYANTDVFMNIYI